MRPPKTLKTNPLEFANPFHHNLLIQADLPFSHRWGADVGLGIITGSSVYAFEEGETFRGIYLRPALKFYIQQDVNWNVYAAAAAKCSWVNNTAIALISRQGGQYLEYIPIDRRRQVLGGQVYFGVQQFMGPKKRFFMEFFVGGGVRRLHLQTNNLPEDGEFTTNEGINLLEPSLQNGTLVSPDAVLGFCVGWRI